MEGQKENMRLCSTGEPTLLVLSVPHEVVSDESFAEAFALPVAIRDGGILLALPDLAVGPQAFAPSEAPDVDTLLGAVKRLDIPLVEETEAGGGVAAVGISQGIVILDFSDEVLSYIREYDASLDGGAWITPFSNERPTALPDPLSVHREGIAWVRSQAETSRVHFYSAQEDLDAPAKGKPPNPTPTAKKNPPAPKRVTNQSIAEQLALISEQMKLMSSRQDQMETALTSRGSAEDVSGPQSGKAPLPRLSDGLHGAPTLGGVGGISLVKKAAMLSGPPPKVRAAGPEKLTQNLQEPLDAFHTEEAVAGSQEEVTMALMQQSTAITALVAHLTGSADPLSELSSSSSGSGTKGLQRREKLQSELAGRTGGFYLTLMQQIHRRMNPGKPLPKTEEELGNTSLLAYLERHGGYRGQRDLGLTMWVAAHALDCMAANDNVGAREYLSLLIVALEQAAADGNWGIAFLLTLIEEPPLSLFQERLANVTPHGKPFAPLVPPAWAAICLAYIREMDLLQTKKKESTGKAKGDKVKEEGDPPSPKRKPRFPKKPVASPDAQ